MRPVSGNRFLNTMIYWHLGLTRFFDYCTLLRPNYEPRGQINSDLVEKPLSLNMLNKQY